METLKKNKILVAVLAALLAGVAAFVASMKDDTGVEETPAETAVPADETPAAPIDPPTAPAEEVVPTEVVIIPVFGPVAVAAAPAAEAEK